MRKRGGTISVDLALFVIRYNTNFMNKLKLNAFLNHKQKYYIDCTNFSNLQNHPTFHSEEKLVNLVRGRECFVGLSSY